MKGACLSADEKGFCQVGREQLGFWYCHPNVITLQNKKTPPNRLWGWDESGWPLFEEQAGLLIKDFQQIIDLQKFVAWSEDESVEAWRKSDYKQFLAACASRPRILPLARGSFRQQLSDGSNKNDRHLARGLEDAELLRAQYNLIVDTVSRRHVLHLNGMNATSSAWYNTLVIAGIKTGFISSFLEMCTSLVTLDLCRNTSLNIDLRELLQKCPATLQNLLVANTSIHGDGTLAPWNRVPSLKYLNLLGTGVRGTVRELEERILSVVSSESTRKEGGLKANERGGDGYGEVPKKCKICPGIDATEVDLRFIELTDAEWNFFLFKIVPSMAKLESLMLSNTDVKLNIDAIVKSLPPTIKRLYLNKTNISGDGKNALWQRLPDLTICDLSHTQVTATKEELTALIPLGAKCFVAT